MPINGTYKLIPQIKEQILSKLYSFVPKEMVQQVLILGSITGYKYNPTSDIDVNVSILPYDLRFKEARHDINGFLAFGTRRPVNFYFTEYKSDTVWNTAVFGVYSIRTGEWLSEPPDASTIRDPKIEFLHSIAYAKIKTRQFNRLVNNYKTKLQQYHRTMSKKTLTAVDHLMANRYHRNTAVAYKQVLDMARAIDQDRKFDYY